MGHLVTATALSPLADRYIHWLELDGAGVQRDREESTADIRAMQLVLRMERDQLPSWHRALAAAATGAAALCLDERAEPGGEWFEAVSVYCRGHIRKVTRRARAGHWEAAADLPGLQIVSGGTEVRVLVPGTVTELDKRIARLQVGGTDVDPDEPTPVPPGPVLTVWLPPEPVMTLGKAMAQTGHAGMIAAALLSRVDPGALQHWSDTGLATVVRRTDAAGWADLRVRMERAGDWSGTTDRVLAVRDAGYTEVPAGSVTVLAEARW